MLNLRACLASSRRATLGAFAIGTIAFSGAAVAAPEAQLFPFRLLLAPPARLVPPPATEAAPIEDEAAPFQLPARFGRQTVSYATHEARGTIGARAMYLGGTVYRIHGTNAPETIGSHVSSGCIRLTSEDVSDLYSRVDVGTKVVVLPMDRRADLGVVR